MRYANDLIPYIRLPIRLHSLFLNVVVPRTWIISPKCNFVCWIMEQLELLLIAVAHTFMQLKTHNQQRKHRWWVHDIIKNRLQQGAYHNLVKYLQFDEEEFQQYFRLTREQFDQVLCYIEYLAFWHSCLSDRKHPTLTSYSRISQLPPSDFVPFCRMNRYMERFSLPHTQPFAAARQIACCIRTYGITRGRLHPCPFLPDNA